MFFFLEKIQNFLREILDHHWLQTFLSMSITVSDLKGPPGTRAPLSLNSFIFMQFSGKFWPNHRLMPSLFEYAPPPGKSWIKHCINWIFLTMRWRDSCERFGGPAHSSDGWMALQSVVQSSNHKEKLGSSLEWKKKKPVRHFVWN